MFLQSVLSSQFFFPIIILLGLASLTSILISVFKLKFLPTFAIEIVIGLIISFWFNDYMVSLHMEGFVNGIYTIGLVMIMFLSGYEVQFDVFKEFDLNEENDCRTCKHKKCRKCKHINIFKVVLLITILVYASSLIVASFFSSHITGNKVYGILLLTLVFASTFAGLIVPIIGNEGLLHTVIGKVLATIANLSEGLSIFFLTILMIAVDVERKYWLILLLIVLLIVIFRIFRKFRIGNFFGRITEGIDHLATRVIIVLILLLVILSDLSGGEYILGAFLAGIFIRQAQFSDDIIHSLSRIIYGVFAPMFFILVGTRIEIMHFINDTSLLLLVLYLFLAILVVELPMLYLLRWYKLSTVVPSIVLMSCTIVVPIAASHINESLHLFSPEFGQALILASILVCVMGTIIFELEFPFGNYKNQYQNIKVK